MKSPYGPPLVECKGSNPIHKEIGCAPNTVRNEIKRGTVALYKGKILRYKATTGQAAHEQNRQVCCRHYDFLKKIDFIRCLGPAANGIGISRPVIK